MINGSSAVKAAAHTATIPNPVSLPARPDVCMMSSSRTPPWTHAAARTALLAAALIGAASSPFAQEVDGEAVYKYCESCHGKRGAGREQGKYPRIAGLPRPYVDKQLHDFKAKRRVNKPMIPIFKHHRFDDQVIGAVAGHIAALPVPDLALWPYEPDPGALAVFPSRAAFDDAGAGKYADACSGCHGERGGGVAAHGTPPLTHQYPAYLRKQIADFASGRRSHVHSDRCAGLTAAEADAVIAHLVELGK
jgi:cytochrome c553